MVEREHEDDTVLAPEDEETIEEAEEEAAEEESPPERAAASEEDDSEAEGDDKEKEKRIPRRKRRADKRFRTLLKQNADVRGENEALKGQVDQERQAREALEARLAKLEEAQGKAHEETIEGQIKETKEALKKAVEDGETERQLELMERMTDLKVKQAQSKAAPKREPPPRARETQTPAPPNRAAVDEWMLDNSWFSDPKYSHYAAMAERLEQRLIQEGYAGYSKELFDELDRRLEKAAPEIKTLRDDDDVDEEEDPKPVRKPKPKEETPTRGQTNVAGNPRQPARRRKSANGFSEEDRAAMASLSSQGFPLNPDDAKHREAWKKYAHRSLDDEAF